MSLVEWGRVAVEGHSRVAGVPLDALQDGAGQLLAQLARAQLRTLGIVWLVELRNKKM